MRLKQSTAAAVLVATCAALSACAGSHGYSGAYDDDGGYYNSESVRQRLRDTPGAVDSDVYYDPFYNLRGTGEFRPYHHIDPNE